MKHRTIARWHKRDVGDGRMSLPKQNKQGEMTMEKHMTIDEIRNLKKGELIRCGEFIFTVIDFDPFWDMLTYCDRFGNRACYKAVECTNFITPSARKHSHL